MERVEPPHPVRLGCTVKAALERFDGLLLHHEEKLTSYPSRGMDSSVRPEQPRIQVGPLPSFRVMLSLKSRVVWAPPTPDSASHALSLALMGEATGATSQSGGMTAPDAVWPPELPRMAFSACHHRDTGEAAPPGEQRRGLRGSVGMSSSTTANCY